MRTKEEAFAILESYRLSMSDSARVVGFLLGKGVIEKGEIVKFGGYDGRKGGELPIITFDDFYEWFESEEELKVLEGLLNFLQDEQDKALEANDVEKADKMALYLGYLVEALELEYEEVRGDEVNDEK